MSFRRNPDMMGISTIGYKGEILIFPPCISLIQTHLFQQAHLPVLLVPAPRQTTGDGPRSGKLVRRALP